MIIANSLLWDLQQKLPFLRSQTYFKSSLIALSHAMEDLILAGTDLPLVIANFQYERFYHQEMRRYRKIAQKSSQVYVLAVPEAESGFAVSDREIETIPLKANDELAREWHLVIIAERYTACLVCREQVSVTGTITDRSRHFEGFWTFDDRASRMAAQWLLRKIANERPELAWQIEQIWQNHHLEREIETTFRSKSQGIDTEIFAQRLVTYLQTSQYKQLKSYRAIAAKERKERLINNISNAIRASLNPQQVLTIAVEELGQTFEDCRCLLYPISNLTLQIEIEYEFVSPKFPSLQGKIWSIIDNPLFLAAQAQDRAFTVDDVSNNSYLQENTVLKAKIERAGIKSWLLVPIRYQTNLIGMLELHYCGSASFQWQEEDISLVEAIATQVGVALTQSQAYADLAVVNRQLEALERTQSNLIAIVGHELRTPLSTIRVCLETLVSEPDLEIQYRQAMLDIALGDAERLRHLVQDFLTLSKLENKQAYRPIESIAFPEALSLALSSLKTSWRQTNLPQVVLDFPADLPLVRVDGDGLVEVLTKLLENACKFTQPQGEIRISTKIDSTETTNRLKPMLKVSISDTGRGIEPTQLKKIFERFYQEEDSLRRSVGGTGLGLAICRQIIQNMGGQIWAYSEGKDRGSQFYFTIPIDS